MCWCIHCSFSNPTRRSLLAHFLHFPKDFLRRSRYGISGRVVLGCAETFMDSQPMQMQGQQGQWGHQGQGRDSKDNNGSVTCTRRWNMSDMETSLPILQALLIGSTTPETSHLSSSPLLTLLTTKTNSTATLERSDWSETTNKEDREEVLAVHKDNNNYRKTF